MNGVLSTDQHSDAELVDIAKSAPSLVGRNLAATVSIDKPLVWDADLGGWEPMQPPTPRA